MRNADMPAMPQSVTCGPDAGVFTSNDFAGCEGLTKREHFAAMAMQGLMGNDGALRRMADSGEANMVSPNKLMASACVIAADALLTELERTS